MPTYANIGFNTAEDYTQLFLVYDQPGTTLQDISGWDIELWVQRYADPSFVLFPKLFTLTASITDGPGGACSVVFPSADTSSEDSRTFWYELRRVDSGFNSCLVAGYLNLAP